jgi:hypothetical protein
MTSCSPWPVRCGAASDGGSGGHPWADRGEGMGILSDLIRHLREVAHGDTGGPGHAAHFVLNRLDGGSDFCCAAHEAEFERNVARYGPPPQPIDQLGAQQRRYLRERLGGDPGPRR